MNEQVIEGLRDILQAHDAGLGSEGCKTLNAAIRALEENPEYWMMDKEGRFGRGPTPYDALVQYLMVAWPEALEALDEVGAKLERRGPRSPVRVGVVWTTDGGIPDEISVYADLSRAEEAYHQWWAKDGVAPEDIEGEKYNRIDGMEAHFYVVDVVQNKDTQVIEVSPCRVREIAGARGIVLPPEQEQEVAQRVAAHLSENVQTEIDYALDSFEGGRDSA